MRDADEDALLATIAAHPADDLPRLVYADWLDEHDRPVRAEFIRLQVEIAKLELLPRMMQNAHIPKWERQQVLLDRHTAELLGPLAGIETTRPPVFDRGFLTELHLLMDDFCRYGDDLSRVTPRPAIMVVENFYENYEHWCPRHLHLVSGLNAANSRSDGVSPIDPVTDHGSAAWAGADPPSVARLVSELPRRRRHPRHPVGRTFPHSSISNCLTMT